MTYAQMTDAQLFEELEKAEQSISHWKTSTDGSYGAAWEYECKPIWEEIKRRGLQ